MGRFALELWIGRELIDRVRFDFPLIAAEETPGVTRRPLHDAPSLVPHAIARIRVSRAREPARHPLGVGRSRDRKSSRVALAAGPRARSAPTSSAAATAAPPSASAAARVRHRAVPPASSAPKPRDRQVTLAASFCARPSVLAPHRIPLSFR